MSANMTQCFDSGAGLTAASAQEMREMVPLSSSPAGMLTVVSAHYPPRLNTAPGTQDAEYFTLIMF